MNARPALYSRLSHFPDEGCSPGEADLPEVAQLSSSNGKAFMSRGCVRTMAGSARSDCVTGDREARCCA